jgi:hypothetical protein
VTSSRSMNVAIETVINVHHLRAISPPPCVHRSVVLVRRAVSEHAGEREQEQAEQVGLCVHDLARHASRLGFVISDDHGGHRGRDESGFASWLPPDPNHSV